MAFFMFGIFVIFLFGPSLGFIDESQVPENIFYFAPDLVEPLDKNRNMTCSDLKVDQSCIIIKSNVNYDVKFLYASMECEKCLLEDESAIQPLSSTRVYVKLASLGTVWEVLDDNNQTLCSKQEQYLGENSMYHIYVNDTGCSLVCDKEAEVIYYPLLIAFVTYLLLAVVWMFGKYLMRHEVLNFIFKRDSLEELAAAYSPSSSMEDSKKEGSQRRLKSLDSVRGFMWMMGMSMALSMRSLLRKAVTRKKIFLKIVKRSIILFSLGIMLNTYCQRVNLQDLRIPGVLQRFSISYFIVATVHLFYASANDDQVSSSSHFRDLTPYGGEWLIMSTFLVTHLLLMFFVHSPNCPAGYFGPGGAHYGGNYSLCTGGAAGYIDRAILGDSHLYQHPEIKKIYNNALPYDPEGILGFLTSIFLVFLGLQAGKTLLTYKEWKARVMRWIIWACITGAVALVLCLGSKNDGFIPVNKNLWSVSFILATGSLAFLLMSICYFVIDVKNWWTGAPFFYAGMNSILLYVGHEMTHNMFPWNWEVESTHMNELFQDLWGTTLWVLIAIWMYYKKFFLAI